MSKTLKKFKKQYDSDDLKIGHHDLKKRKLVIRNKQLKSLDKMLKTKDVSKLLNMDD